MKKTGKAYFKAFPVFFLCYFLSHAFSHFIECAEAVNEAKHHNEDTCENL